MNKNEHFGSIRRSGQEKHLGRKMRKRRYRGKSSGGSFLEGGLRNYARQVRQRLKNEEGVKAL